MTEIAIRNDETAAARNDGNIAPNDGNIARNGSPSRAARSFLPAVDILEREHELLLRADIPGADKDAVEVNFEAGTLTLRARVPDRHPVAAPADGKASDVQWLLREYATGDYERRFALSDAIDAEAIRAEFADGVLVLHLPKAEAAKPRRIPVSTGG